MNRKTDVIAYNLIFPIWSIVIFPPIFLFTMPLNFLIDSIVCLIGLAICSKQIWADYKKYILKIFLFGYLADIIGAIPLAAIYMADDGTSPDHSFTEALSYNVFLRLDSLLFMTAIVALVGWLIYFFNRKFVFKTEEPKKARLLAILLAVLTTPYFFYFPVDWFWY